MKRGMSGLRLLLGPVLFFALLMPLMAESTGTQKMQNAEKKAVTGAENLAIPETIEMTADDYKFTPSEITVPAGRKVRIVLTNKANKAHNIQFDLPENHAMKLSKDIGHNETGTLEFTAPPPGTYSFKCPVDLHSTLGMHGKMITK